jgi:formylglycine-generating enzyme required for sulfatase activity
MQILINKHITKSVKRTLCSFALACLSVSCDAQKKNFTEKLGENNTQVKELVLIPAGEFKMGRTSGDDDEDAPPVTVNVSAFYMARHEVTKALWDEVRTWAAANGYKDLATLPVDGVAPAANHPVQAVSWWDAIKWCNARSEKERLTPCYTVGAVVMKTGTTLPTVNWSANGYRLPTEAEWEKAARGGVNGKRFPWGTDTVSEANFWNDFDPQMSHRTDRCTSPVGVLAANGYGLHDMAGNVWEWCWDWYGASTYVNGATDPRGAASGTSRVTRGGSWISTATTAWRAANRDFLSPDASLNTYGFRVVRSSVP